jgi:hypothetical protein
MRQSLCVDMREAICSRICSHPLSFLHLFEINNFGQTYEIAEEFNGDAINYTQ